MARRLAGLPIALFCGFLLAWVLTFACALAQTASQSTPAAQAPTVRFVSPDGLDQGDCVANPCATVQYAVDQAARGEEIRIARGNYSDIHARFGMTQTVYISKSLSLRGGWNPGFDTWQPARYPTILNAGGRGRVLVISGTIAPALTGLRITGGKGFDYGGGIYVNGATVTITDCRVYENDAAYGGGIYLVQGQGLLAGNNIISNTAFWRGGGLYLVASPAELRSNQIAANQATLGGGGLYLQDSPATLYEDRITENSALSGEGGGLALGNSAAGITRTQVTLNQARAGGGLHLNGSPAILSGNTIALNSAANDGGGLYLEWSNAALEDNTLAGNRAVGTGRHGGGLYSVASRPVLMHNSVADNSAALGGGLYMERGIYTLKQNSVLSNTASAAGGGIYVLGGPEGGPAVLANNLIHWNRADQSGGGAYLFGLVAVTLTGNSLLTNTVQSYGGGLYLGASRAVLENNLLGDNRAVTGVGGGLYLEGTNGPIQAQLKANRLQGNMAGQAGGGLFLNDADASFNATIVQNNRVEGEFAAGGGAYLYRGQATFTNTIVADNAVAGQYAVGSGFLADGPGYRLLHTTMVRNTGAEGSGIYVATRWSVAPAHVILTNTIIAGQSTGVYAGTQGTAQLAGTLWGNGIWINANRTAGAASTTMDVEGDPAFVLPDLGNYHIGVTSAAIDRGLNAGTATDIDRQRRPNPNTNIPDMGADEWYPPQRFTYLPIVLR